MKKTEPILSVALLVPSLAQKGPVIVAQNLAFGLNEKNIAVQLFYLKETSLDKISLPENIIPQKLTRRTCANLLQNDVIHSHSFLPDLISAFLFLVYRKKIKFVTTLHNIIFEELKYSETSFLKKSILQNIWPLSWRFKHLCITLTQTAQKKYNHHMPFLSKTITYAYNGIFIPITNLPTQKDLDILDSLRKLKTKKKIIGSCAALTKLKNLDLVINALLYLPPTYELIIVGNGPDKIRLIEQAKTLELSNRIHFFEHTKVPLQYMMSFDIFVMPSRSEGFGLTAVEAISQGNKLVASDIDVFKELFKDYSSVTLTPIDNAEIFAHAILVADNIDPVIHQKESQRIVQQFSYQEMTKNYIQLYASLPH